MERECLAVMWAISKFRPYLFGKHLTIVTDHHSLCWLVGLKDPTGRLARWALRLQEHDVSIMYKSGKKHRDADSLSRNPVENGNNCSESAIAAASFMNIAEEQQSDPELSKIIRSFDNPETNRKNYELMKAFSARRT